MTFKWGKNKIQIIDGNTTSVLRVIYQSAAMTMSKFSPGMAAWCRLQCNVQVRTLVSPNRSQFSVMFFPMSAIINVKQVRSHIFSRTIRETP